MDPASLVLEILGGILVGASLGLIGAGGAILSLPIFALVLGHPNKVAGIEALVVTGAVAAWSAARAAIERRVDVRRALAFAVPGIAGAWIGAPIGRMLPEVAHASIFAALAGVAAWRMLARPPAEPEQAEAPRPRDLAFAGAVGLAIGIVTSVIGVGGGFLLLPALVLVMKMRMPVAVGTSLLLIATNALFALLSHLRHSPEAIAAVDWAAVAIVSGGGMFGSTLGGGLGARLSAAALRKGFAAVLLLVGAVVLLEGLGVFVADR